MQSFLIFLKFALIFFVLNACVLNPILEGGGGGILTLYSGAERSNYLPYTNCSSSGLIAFKLGQNVKLCKCFKFVKTKYQNLSLFDDVIAIFWETFWEKK